MAHENQSTKYPVPEVADKTNMGKVGKIASGAVDDGKDSKPNLPADLNRLSK